MIFIQTDLQNRVKYTHYMPFHEKYGLGLSKEQLEKEGFLIETIPEPQQVEGKQSIMCYNPITKKIFYKYEDIPKTKEELQQENMDSLVQIIAKLNLENKKKDIMATTLAQIVATLNLRVNKLEKEKEGR